MPGRGLQPFAVSAVAVAVALAIADAITTARPNGIETSGGRWPCATPDRRRGDATWDAVAGTDPGFASWN